MSTEGQNFIKHPIDDLQTSARNYSISQTGKSGLGAPVVLPRPKSSFSVVINSSPKNLQATLSAKRGPGIAFERTSAINDTQHEGKKRGRPFKESTGLSSEAQGDSFIQSAYKKRGRPFKYPQQPEEIITFTPPEPSFVSFVCEWKDCLAELHNLDTLRAHLVTVHLKRLRRQSSGGPLRCLWKRCCQPCVSADKELGQTEITEVDIEFKNEEDWINHVEEAHLSNVAWYQGDGPKSKISYNENVKPALTYSWLQGGPENQPTPSVRYQEIEDGRAKINNAARFVKQRDGIYAVLVPIPAYEPHKSTATGDNQNLNYR